MTARNCRFAIWTFVTFATVGCSNPNPVAPAASVESAADMRAGGTLRAAAASDGAAHVTVPVSFAFSAGTCGLTTNVTATGSLTMTIHSLVTGPGVVRVTVNARASGTAAGADGSKYVFAYNQTFTQEDASSFPIPIRATDVFELTGLGDAPNVRTGFVATAEILSNGQLSNAEFKTVRGNPFACDPL